MKLWWSYSHVQIIPAHSEQVPSEDWQSFRFVSVPAHPCIFIPLVIVSGGAEQRPPVLASNKIQTLKFSKSTIY